MTFFAPAPRSDRAAVIAALMREALELMEEVARLNVSQRACLGGRRETLSAAAVARLSARLARISGWLLLKSAGAPCDPAARVILAQALRGRLDRRRHDWRADALARRVDRLAANAIRLDTMLSRKTPPPPVEVSDKAGF